MAITIKGTPYKDFTSITLLVQPTGTWPAVTAERLILIITTRAWTAGATRTITATYGGVNVPVVATNSLTPAVTSFDIVWWVGELANPTSAKVDLVVTADGTTRGLNTVGYFVDGAKATGATIILDSQASDANGNTVILSGAPSAVGGLVVNSSMMAKITTISSFTPGTWSVVQEGSSGPSSQATSSIRHDPIVSLAAITATTQWVDTDVQRGGVLVEIAPAAAPAASIEESLSPSDSASAVVAATVTQEDAATPADSALSQVPADATPENPVGVYQAATAAWKLPSGADVKGANPLTAVSGMSAASLKGSAATLTTASFARRPNPVFAGGVAALSFEFWVRPAALSSASTLIYLGPTSTSSSSAYVSPPWNFPIRSGRAWSTGVSFWNDNLTLYEDEESDVALLDMGCGSTKASDRGNVSTFTRLIGGAVGSPMDSTDTQFDWRSKAAYVTADFGFGNVIAHMPVNATLYPDGAGWLVWVIGTVPETHRTDGAGGNPDLIWDEINAGLHDDKYLAFGARVIQKMTAVGHPVKRLIIDPNHEMNTSNYHQIFSNTRAKYVSAMERTITRIREGAGTTDPNSANYLRFMHRPAYRPEADMIGIPYDSFIPNNVDVLSLSWHPRNDCDTSAKVDQLFAGTLNPDYYGTDELLTVARAMGRKIAFPEWGPEDGSIAEPGIACPVANTFVTKFYNDVLVPAANEGLLICDGVFHEDVRSASSYDGGDSAGQTQYTNFVSTRKVLFSGIKSSSPSSSRLFAAGDIDDAGTNIVAFASHLNNLMSATPTAKFMPLGDLVYPDGATSEYTRYNGRFSGIKSRTIPCPGNHDYGSSGPAPYLAYFSSIYSGGPAYFRQVIDANWVVYSLNTNISVTSGSAQGIFLETQLSAETQPGRIFITHHPWKSSGTTHGPEAGLSHLINMAKTHLVSLWLVAHEHHYERFAPDTGVRTIVVGTGGHSQTYSFGSPAAGSEVRNGSKGVLQLDLRSTDYTGLFRPVSGSFADTFTDPINGL